MNEKKTIDKELYRQAYEGYRQWFEAKEAERAQIARAITPAEAWTQYVSLVEFGWKLSPDEGERQSREKIRSLEDYYARIQKMEAWRRAHGKKP